MSNIGIEINKLIMENFFEMFDQKQLDDICLAIQNHQNYNLDKDGLKVKVSNTENGTTISVSINDSEESKAVALNKDFKKYIESLDDELFIAVCESIGTEKLEEIQNNLQSKKLEQVEIGIINFILALKEVLLYKIKDMQTLLKEIADVETYLKNNERSSMSNSSTNR